MVSLLSIYFIGAILFLLLLGLITLFVKIERPIRFMVIISIILFIPLLVIYVVSTSWTTTPETRVPNLVGLTESQAQKVAGALGLKVSVVQKTFEKNVPADQIISQRPETGRSVKKGRNISLVVSIGKRKVFVPNLVGKDYSQIEVVLDEVGLQIGDARRVVSQEFASNTIMSQHPSTGTEVIVGTQVSVTVCHNPDEEFEDENEGTEEAESEE
ncbi:MAG: PASTA domain-containing protein [Candidatus Margulisbacteria bacterium]|nr:PASTA domain-containing protein [Candidatus Margulisiibacteriota bacterium]MBU1022455.1 PASTA domain-containing protein [Candidatus Margulisiibacteriota bacterium]MBU1728439.1 PASTA domain-containing protein [Candidatus Margulisiibacteriota bacterium]MBU1954586.1 PASTA domain-containing protein [Candidatus Margulisiibacteriota bacterium]